MKKYFALLLEILLLATLMTAQTNIKADKVTAKTGNFDTVTVAGADVFHGEGDVRQKGIDCTGATDSSAALNTLTAISDAMTGKILRIPNDCHIRLEHQWLIHAQEFFTIDGGGGINATNGARIFGCGSETGALIKVSRSGYFTLNGVSVEAKGSCTSAFTGSVESTNSAAGGYTSTDHKLVNVALSSSWSTGAGVAGYYGWHINGAPNQETFQLKDSIINCQASSGSYGLWNDGQNADSTNVTHARVSDCYRGIYAQSGTVNVKDSMFLGNGSFSVYGAGGATFYEGQIGCVRSLETSIVGEASGQLLSGNGDAVGGSCPYHYFASNQIGIDDIDPNVYPININGASTKGPGATILFDNSFSHAVSQTIHNGTLIGSDASCSGTCGAYARLITSGNTYDTTYLTAAEWATPQPMQLGQVNFDLNSYSSFSSLDFALGERGKTSRSAWLKFRSFGTMNDEYGLFSIPTRTNSSNSSSLILDHTGQVVNGVAILPPIMGGLISQAVTIGTIGGVDTRGAAGSTTWGYKIVGVSGGGFITAASAEATTVLGNATLTTTNKTHLQWYWDAGIAYYKIYRTTAGGTPNTTGLIGIIRATDMDNLNGNIAQFYDTGLAGDGSTPPSSSTADGRIVAPVFAIPGADAGSYVKADGSGYGTPTGGGGAGSDRVISLYFNTGGWGSLSGVTLWPSVSSGMVIKRLWASLTATPPTCTVAPTFSIKQWNGSGWSAAIVTASLNNTSPAANSIYMDSGVITVTPTAGQNLAAFVTAGTCTVQPTQMTVYVQYQ